MAPSMARLVLILSIVSSLFLVSLARHSIDLDTKPETQLQLATKPETQNETLLQEEPNTTVVTLDANESTELEILDPTKKVEEERDTQVSNLALPDGSSERQVVVESDPGMVINEVIGWQPREDEEKKEEKVVRKKKSKKGNESDSDSDSDSDDEEEEREKDGKKKKKKRKERKKLGFWRRLWKLINPFEYSL